MFRNNLNEKLGSGVEFTSALYRRSNRILEFYKIRAPYVRMAHEGVPTKRPTCPSCSKPAVICLCDRLKVPPLNNSVAITILQHSLEKKHPLNSARIATLGIKNVDVITVSDVNFQSRFVIRLLEAKCDDGHTLFDEMPSRVKGPESGAIDLDGHCGKISNFDEAKLSESCEKDEQFWRLSSRGKPELNSAPLRTCESIAINFTIEKYGNIISCDQNGKDPSKWRKMNGDQLMSPVHDSRNGFAVTKFQSKPIEEDDKYENSKEFDILVPPGSALLFPSEESIAIEDAFEVKNLIVLDGTWAKAKRMYNENPWLKLLPHLRLDSEKLSLYGEVRHQPRAGYLSTIESIVQALKSMGEDSDGLSSLLEVFQSMVDHQRRCKDHRLSRVSMSKNVE